MGAITVTYDDKVNVTGTAIPADLAPCGQAVTLTAGKCTYDQSGYKVAWTVTNPNTFAVPFGWTSDNAPSTGTGTAALSSTADFSVPYTGTGTLTVDVSAFGAVSPAPQTITPACPKITVTPPADMTICAIDATTFTPQFSVTTENIDLPATASLTITRGTANTTTFTGTGTSLVNGQTANWPGIYDGLASFSVTWDYLAQLNGITVKSGVVTYSYNAETDREKCQLPNPEDLLIIDPYCTLYNGNWAMAWEVNNPNPWAVPFSWVLNHDSATLKNGIVLAGATEPLEFTELGTQNITVAWVDGTGTEKTVSLDWTINQCEQEKKKTEEPTPVSTPPVVNIPVTGAQATLAAPQTEGALLIPVTGADLQPIQYGGAFFTNLYTHLGLFFVGLALVLTGLNKKFLK